MLGFGEVASLAINLPLDASNGKLVMGPHEVVLNAQTDMVDMKYDFTARNALIDLKVVNDDKFDMKLGFKSGRQWPKIETCYKYNGIPILDGTQVLVVAQLVGEFFFLLLLFFFLKRREINSKRCRTFSLRVWCS